MRNCNLNVSSIKCIFLLLLYAEVSVKSSCMFFHQYSAVLYWQLQTMTWPQHNDDQTKCVEATNSSCHNLISPVSSINIKSDISTLANLSSRYTLQTQKDGRKTLLLGQIVSFVNLCIFNINLRLTFIGFPIVDLYSVITQGIVVRFPLYIVLCSPLFANQGLRDPWEYTDTLTLGRGFLDYPLI